jgi:hypothetical protein
LTSNKGTWFVTTPGQVTLHRGYQDLAIECEKAGMTPSIATAASHVRPIFFGNILFGGVIGILVDLGDGAAFDYDDLITIDVGAKAPTVQGMLAPVGQEPLVTPVITVEPTTISTPVVTPVAVVPTPAVPTPPPATPTAHSLRNERRYQISAEAFAKSQSCAATPVATLTAVGPGSETYVIPCVSGESLIARCEFGNCRALK